MKDTEKQLLKLISQPRKLSEILLDYIPDPEERAKYEKYSENHDSVVKNILKQIEVKHGRKPTVVVRQSKAT